MQWRPIGNAGDAYPDWVRALRSSSGVYAIRVSGWFSPTIVYVGESHTDNLYKTLTRHFAKWSRWKRPPQTVADWWAKARVFSAEDTDPGRTYKRGDCEVAIEVARGRTLEARKAKALALQDAWIRRLKPRDNKIDSEGQELEEAPF